MMPDGDDIWRLIERDGQTAALNRVASVAERAAAATERATKAWHARLERVEQQAAESAEVVRGLSRRLLDMSKDEAPGDGSSVHT